MKKQLICLLFLLLGLSLHAETLVWGKENNFKGWNQAIRAKKQIVNGVLVLTSIKFDCRIVNNLLDIDPQKYDTFTFIYRTTGGNKKKGELFYCHAGEKFSDSRRWDTPSLIGDGKWHTVSVSCPDRAAWIKGGSIRALRFDPTNSAGGKIEIKEMRLERKKAGEAKKKSKLDAPVWPRIKPEIWPKDKFARGTGKYFEGKMIRSPEDKLKGGKYHEFYLRRSFVLKEKPVHGYLQYTADDCSEAFVNGNHAGNSHDWRSCVTLDVSRFLKVGKNVLAIHYVNEDTFGGVIAELYLQYADGRTERISTDKNFKTAVKVSDNWMNADFDDSRWTAAVEQAPPPARPWTIRLPYRYFQNMQKILTAGIRPRRTAAGSKVKLQMYCQGKMPEKDLRGFLVTKQNGKMLFREEVTIKRQDMIPLKNGSWKFEIPVETPLYLKAGKFSFGLDTDLFSAQSEVWKDLCVETLPVKVDPAYPAANICRVVNKNGTPEMELNGKPFFASWLNPPANFHYMPVPVNLVTVGASHSAVWPRVGEFVPEALDLAAERARRRFPGAYFMWGISLVVPADWADKYPDEMALDQKGERAVYVYPPHSYSSPTARKHFEEIMEKVVTHLKKSPYANRIIGYRFSGGYTGEFLGWEPRGSALDFSPCGKAAYEKFVTEKYPALNKAVPPRGLRFNRDQDILWDLKKYQRAVAYQEFISRQVMDLLLPLCRKMRQLVGRDKLFGIYYGYTSTLHHPGNSQYRAYYELKRLLEAKLVDFLMSPNSYVLRNLGQTCGEMKPFRTLQNNNIIPVCEDDTRTHNSYDVTKRAGSRDQTMTERHSIAVERRNMGIAICRTSPNYFFPLVGGSSISFPAMQKEIAVMRTVGQHCREAAARRKAQVALVVSEESIKSMPNLGGHVVPSGIIDQYYCPDGRVQQIERVKNVINFETFIGNQDRFTRSGALIDQVLAEDLADHPGDYKLYVFLNCYKADGNFRKAVARLQQRNCILLWLYAPGYYKGSSGNTGNMKALTGMDFKKISDVSASVKLRNGRLMGTSAARISPMFAVTTRGAEILGTYENGQPGIAAVRTGKALSVFSGVWKLDQQFIEMLIKRAGVYRYADGNDPLEANDKLIVLHARFAGKKVIRLPRKAQVLDVFAKKIISSGKDHFESTFALHETKWFYFGPDAPELLKKLCSL